MKTKHLSLTAALALGGLITIPAHADTFGSGANTFTIDFVNIGNAGNADDAGAGGGTQSSPYGGVPYNYRMGVTEVPQDWINKANALGLLNVTAGPWTGLQPAGNMTWFEAAAFVNFLNTSTGHQAAYNLDAGATTLTLWSSAQAWQAGGQNLYRHKDAFYFLPSEDEWYKAAYHKNDGVTANYWDFATGSNSAPDGLDFSGDPAFDAVYNESGFSQGFPNVVTNVGIASPYGTFGQNGNEWEWQESAFDGLNDTSSENREARSGSWANDQNGLQSAYRAFNLAPSASDTSVGLRVASVPEPGTFGLLAMSSLLLAARRRP